MPADAPQCLHSYAGCQEVLARFKDSSCAWRMHGEVLQHNFSAWLTSVLTKAPCQTKLTSGRLA